MTMRTDAEVNRADGVGVALGSADTQPDRARHRRQLLVTLGAVAIGFVAAIAVPLSVGDRFLVTVILTAGVFTLAAVGLNLLSGYLGEASLGHAFFMGIGAYVGIWAGETLGLPLLAWIPVVLIAGAAVGALTGPLALRLRGGHLLIVSIGLVFIGQWIFTNARDLTGGPNGRPVNLPLAIGPIDFGDLVIGGTRYTAVQSLAVLVWIVCVIAIVVVRNIARSRTGRAMRAIRDNELAASASGVSLFRAKMGAFIVSSAIAALAGAFFAQQLRYLEPTSFSLLLSIQIAVVLIIGGSGSTAGPVIGAFFFALTPLLLQRLEWLPFVLSPNEEGFGLTAGELSNFIFAVLLVLILLFEPEGIVRLLARLWNKITAAIKRRTRAKIGEN